MSIWEQQSTETVRINTRINTRDRKNLDRNLGGAVCEQKLLVQTIFQLQYTQPIVLGDVIQEHYVLTSGDQDCVAQNQFLQASFASLRYFPIYMTL
jgi:hypothetical protein